MANDASPWRTNNPVYVLTEDDRRQVAGLLRASLTGVKTYRPRPEEPDEPNLAQDIFVARTPTNGIPAMTGTVPGSALCECWFLNTASTPPAIKQPFPSPRQVLIYNTSTTAIQGLTWIITVRAQDGNWYATSGAGGSTLQTAAILQEFDDYLWCAPFTFPIVGSGSGSGSGTGTQIYDPNLGRLIISSASWTANVATFTTTAMHGLVTGTHIKIQGVVPVTYNGSYVVVSASTAWTFTVELDGDPGAYTNCGTIINLDTAFYVAKPFLLQRTPWDGQVVPYPDGTYHWLQYAQQATSAVVVASGSGYTVDDVLTVSGGTFGTAAQFSVSAVSGGAVAAVEQTNGGAYTTTPTNAVSTTGGGGSGCTLNLVWESAPWARSNTIVVPQFANSCTMLTDGGGVVFASQDSPVWEYVTPEYAQGEVIGADNGPTGLTDPNGNAITLTDANNGGRGWQEPEASANVQWFKVNGVSTSNSSYYDATLLGFTPGTPPAYPTRAQKVWLVTPMGLALTPAAGGSGSGSGGGVYAAVATTKTGQAQPSGGGTAERRSIYAAIGGWLTMARCVGGQIENTTY